ncbi:hypothetical protein PHLGIDRAFT_307580 [Phlebiopsis gigantea 11061_1 CR5-6]|uniref:Uncharacterized protein n=1 Tax=Phlebiopsis gigantea (strain 11061_1 CR5-6) TaxID=745531 RepID=A0A0C3S2R8_PHLG1|nr:hypothetical protein PHLGIDRAFT_307580 [Phlebiopsis gigantea 11061_1 CR5-6]
MLIHSRRGSLFCSSIRWSLAVGRTSVLDLFSSREGRDFRKGSTVSFSIPSHAAMPQSHVMWLLVRVLRLVQTTVLNHNVSTLAKQDNYGKPHLLLKSLWRIVWHAEAP